MFSQEDPCLAVLDQSFGIHVVSKATEISLKIKSVHRPEPYLVRIINSDSKKQQSIELVKRMYSKKGYNVEHFDFLIKQDSQGSEFTILIETEYSEPLGTLTVGIDNKNGLYADFLYKNELDQLRDSGSVLCEFRKLAILPDVKNRRLISSLFHVALLYTRHFFSVTDCISEVTPLHSKFYKRFLEASQLGDEKLCPRVNTNGVLMHLSMLHAEKRALESGGQMSFSHKDKSLYPFFFSPTDAKKMLQRLREIHE